MIDYDPFLSGVGFSNGDEMVDEEFEDMDDYEETDEEFDDLDVDDDFDDFEDDEDFDDFDEEEDFDDFEMMKRTTSTTRTRTIIDRCRSLCVGGC